MRKIISLGIRLKQQLSYRGKILTYILVSIYQLVERMRKIISLGIRLKQQLSYRNINTFNRRYCNLKFIKKRYLLEVRPQA